MTDKTEKMNVNVGRTPKAVNENAFAPLVDIYETADNTTVLVAEIPGTRPQDVDIRVDKGTLTVTAEAAVAGPGEGFDRTYTGFVGGQFYRAFALGDEIDREKIEASLADGVLTLRLPRAAAAKTRKIDVKAG